MGDVALLAAACKAWLQENPNANMTLVTRKGFTAFFNFSPQIQIIAPDFEGKNKGLVGLFLLFREIRRLKKFDFVLDAHDVLRTQILRKFFILDGNKILVYNKNRKEKKLLTQRENKNRSILKHTVQRYLDIFPGNRVQWNDHYLPVLKVDKFKVKIPKVGIAPFAQQALKILPIATIKDVLIQISKEAEVYLFGSKGHEYHELKILKKDHDQVFIASELCSNLEEELALMAQMNVMLSMDSANMHMATLVGTPVVSVWGSTHPNLGFKALGASNDSLQVQISTNELSCRPCSVFGNTTCYRGDLACLNRITAKQIVEKLRSQF